MAIGKIFYPAAIEAAGSVGAAEMTRPRFVAMTKDQRMPDWSVFRVMNLMRISLKRTRFWVLRICRTRLILALARFDFGTGCL
jgi:hypothetical protein